MYKVEHMCASVALQSWPIRLCSPSVLAYQIVLCCRSATLSDPQVPPGLDEPLGLPPPILFFILFCHNALLP